jgi:hypothetical protein
MDLPDPVPGVRASLPPATIQMLSKSCPEDDWIFMNRKIFATAAS